MSADLSATERAVALALYRKGGGVLTAVEFDRALYADPVAQAITRAVTPIVAEVVQRLAAIVTTAGDPS